MNHFTLITGASKGIGRAYALRFAAEENNLILIARDINELRRLKEEIQLHHRVEVILISENLNSPGAVDRILKKIRDNGAVIENLVNNAGFGILSDTRDIDQDNSEDLIRLNISVVVEMTQKILKMMVRENHGKIINIASTGAFQPGPAMALYYASKAFLLSWSEALRFELRHTGIRVITVCPGPVLTPFHDRAGSKGSALVNGWLPVFTAEEVARVTFPKIMKGRAVIVPGLVNRLLALSVRFSPRAVVTRVAAAFIH